MYLDMQDCCAQSPKAKAELETLLANHNAALRLLEIVANIFGRGAMKLDSVTLTADSPIIEEINAFLVPTNQRERV